MNYLVLEQSGFRKDKCINDSLSKINIEVQNTFNKQFMGMVSMNIPKAYDSTWKPLITKNLN